MNVADSSAWIEFVNGGPNEVHFCPVIEDTATLLVPSIVVYEVFKLILRNKGEKAAQRVAAAMRQGRAVAIDESLALSAAKLSLQYHLAMADSLIYATALAHGATLWTQDEDFEHVPGVRHFAKACSV
ncbi:MAG: type II toxin-antitoxin system VapC family toxin [Methylococcales bacterium]